MGEMYTILRQLNNLKIVNKATKSLMKKESVKQLNG